MWKYSANNAYDSISLHDCRADRIELDGNELVFYFPDGFRTLTMGDYINHAVPVRTGPSQVRFELIMREEPFDDIEIYRTMRIFGKDIFCRRILPGTWDFLKMINREGYELEFWEEYHSLLTSLYRCCIWKNGITEKGECQLKISASNIEYCWNEIMPDRQ